jgi:hypothetical protein
MPTVNIFTQNDEHKIQLNKKVVEIKSYIAHELTCGDIKLDASEVSVRFIDVTGDGLIGELEVEITAHAFKERIKNQDDICLSVKEWLSKLLPNTEIRVWLLLPQLGHSWK